MKVKFMEDEFHRIENEIRDKGLNGGLTVTVHRTECTL